MSRPLELPQECPAPGGDRAPCTGTNFLPVEGEGGGVKASFTNVQVRLPACCINV